MTPQSIAASLTTGWLTIPLPRSPFDGMNPYAIVAGMMLRGAVDRSEQEAEENSSRLPCLPELFMQPQVNAGVSLSSRRRSTHSLLWL